MMEEVPEIRKIVRSILSIATDISSLMRLLVTWFVKPIDMQNNTYKGGSLPNDRKLFNGNQVLVKKCSNFWALLLKWD